MYAFIVNPTAGTGYANIVAEKVFARLQEKGIEYQVFYTEYANHATELAAKAAADGFETVVALGGDGTVSQVAKGLRNTGVPMGIIPCGTGNDFVKSIGIPMDWEMALEKLLTSPARPVNSGLINDQFFINLSGTGFDVKVLDYALEAKKYVRGIWPYLYGVLKEIFHYHPFELHIEVGDTVLDGSYLLCCFGNGKYCGGGIPVAPLADPSDGLFDVMVIDTVPRWKIPFYLPALMTGKLHTKSVAHRYLVDKGLLRSPGMRLNVDGEIISIDECTFICEKEAVLLHY